MSEDREILTLEFDDGSETEYYVEGVVEHAGQDYIVLVEVKDEDMLEVLRLKSVSEDEDEITPIEDDKEYDAVLDELRKCGYDIRVED